MKKITFILFIFYILSINAVNFDWGYIKFFSQFQYKLEETKPNTFLIKRMRLKAFGNIVENKITFKAQIDFNTGSIDVLDMMGTFIINNYFSINVGRFLIPFDYYTNHSSADLNALDYPFLDSYYSPYRQEGVLIKFKNNFSAIFAGIFNGGNKNSYSDSDSEKAYLLRTDVTLFKGINLYFSGYLDNYLDNIQWIKKRNVLGGFYMKEKNFFTIFQGQYNENDEINTDRDIFSYGYFLHFSFFIKNIEIFARYELIDKNTVLDGFVETHLTTGINYNFKGTGTKISVNYQKNGETAEVPDDKLLFQFQFTL